MKQQISTLMDGEMTDDEAEELLAKIRSNPEARQEWANFHLISDAMRQPDYVSRDLSISIFERLESEPTILAPQPKRYSKKRYFAMSAVASIMAMAFLAWFAMHINSGGDNFPVMQMAQQPAGSGVILLNDGMNDYLVAHHEFSPSTDLRGASSYIHTVAIRH